MNNLRTIGGGGNQIAVAYAEPPVSPPVSRPMAAATPAAVHVAPVAPVASMPQPSQPEAPAVAPPAAAPEPVSQPAGQAVPVDETVAVFLYLRGGARIWAGRFESLDLAEQRAHEIVRALIRPEPGVWAQFGNRLIRPDAVVSIELAPRRED